MATLSLKTANLFNPITSNLSGPYEDIRVFKAFSKNSIVITENKNRVYLFQIDDTKIINEWRLNALHTLSSEAIQHPDKIHFSAIIDQLTLKTWTINDTTMHHKTNSLKLSKPGLGLISLESGSIIIIYEDGCLGCTGDIHSNWKPDNMIENSFVIKDYNHLIVNDYCLVRILLVDDTNQNYIIEYKISENSNFQVTSTIDLVKSPFHKNLNLNAGLKLTDNFVSVSLDAQQYLVIGQLPNSDNFQPYIYIWDDGFEIIRSKEECRALEILKILRIEDSIILVTVNGVFEIFLNYQPSSLISCILHHEEQEIEYKSLSAESNTNLQYIYNTYLNEFHDKLKEWINVIDKLEPCQRVLIRAHVDPVVLQLTQRYIIGDVCREIINIILSILQTGLVTSRCCDSLIDLLEKSQDINLLISITKYISNISEANIVDILTILMKITNCEDLKIVESSSYLALNGILKLPFTRVDMIVCLKELQFDHLLVLLQTLFNFLTHNENADDLYDFDDVNIIDWLSILLDCHYTKLILHSDYQIFINDIRTYIKQKISEANKRVFANFKEKYITYQRRSKMKQKRKKYRLRLCVDTNALRSWIVH